MQQQVLQPQAQAGRPLPVVLTSCKGARRKVNLTPLLAKIGQPVVVHGVLDDSHRVTSAEIFRALGLPWSENATHAQRRLDKGKPVFVPISALSAQLDRQLGLGWWIGVRNGAHTLATPFDEQGALHLASVSLSKYIGRVASILPDRYPQFTDARHPG